MSTFLLGLDEAERYHIQKEDIRRVDVGNRFVPQKDCSFEAFGEVDNQQISWKRTYHGVEWRITRNVFRLTETFINDDYGQIQSSNEKEKLLLKKRDFGGVIQIKRQGKLIDQFKVIELKESKIERYPHEIKQLTVLRFDDSAEQKLYNYVDSLVFDVLNYKPTPVDSTAYNELIKSGAATILQIKIRDSREVNPKPLLVINDYLIDNYEFLKQFLFVEAISFEYLTKVKAPMLYGASAINGVIVIQLSNRKFKKVQKHKV